MSWHGLKQLLCTEDSKLVGYFNFRPLFTDVTITDRSRKPLCWLRWIHLDSAFRRKKQLWFVDALLRKCGLLIPRVIPEAPSSSSSPSTRSSCFSAGPVTELVSRRSPCFYIESTRDRVTRRMFLTITGLFHVIPSTTVSISIEENKEKRQL